MFDFKRGWCAEALPTALANQLLTQPETLLSSVSCVYKSDKKTQVYQLTIAGHAYCLKVYPLRTSWQKTRCFFFKHRAQRNVNYAKRCQQWHIPTFEPLGYSYVNQTYYLLTSDIPGQTALEEFGYHADMSDNASDYANQIIQIIHQLRAHRHIHHDMNLSNFKIYQGRVYLLDLDGMRPFCWYDSAASTKDAVRFLENWEEHEYANPKALAYFKDRLSEK